jgi:hypothetical protein
VVQDGIRKAESVMTKGFSWYRNRLGRMSVPEVTHRVWRFGFTRAQRFGFFGASKVPLPDCSCAANQFIGVPNLADPKQYCQAAERMLRNGLSVFNVTLSLGPQMSWNQDPKTGIESPQSFGKTLNYRNPELVGDIKYLWEPNRHLHLVTFAQAYRLTGNRRYLAVLRDQFDTWLQQCPYLIGPNWASSLELAIRLINWSIVWQLIGGHSSELFAGEDGNAFRRRLLGSIYQHVHFIAGHLSRFSSANNHLIGEAAGLFVAGCTWPVWQDMKAWKEIGYKLLTKESALQNSEDGVNREQAISYQQFVLDFLILAALAGRASGTEFPEGYWRRIESMIEFIASVMDVEGHVPMIGDADDGYVVRLSQEDDFCNYRSLLATGAVLFGRGDFKRKAGRPDDKTRWLLGKETDRFFGIGDAKKIYPIRQEFPEGGYYILGTGFETSREVRIVADAGPLGYRSIAAHGHADALALTLSAGGREFLIDPGTYAYHTQQQWREFFRGTSAHNTVRVDGQDQSISGGNFMWIRHAQAKCEEWVTSEQEDRFTASHDGYLRLSDPVLHRRELRFDKTRMILTVADTIVCRQQHEIERFWHLSEHCDVHQEGRQITIVNGGLRIVMRPLEEEVELTKARGDLLRPAGWVSRHFDAKAPTTTLIWKSRVDRTCVLRTVIDCSGAFAARCGQCDEVASQATLSRLD